MDLQNAKGDKNMRKHDELSIPDSCLNRAKSNEMLFVLLGRDKAAPAAIRAWDNDAIRWSVNGVDSVYHWGDIESFVVTPIPELCDCTVNLHGDIKVCSLQKGHPGSHSYVQS